MLETIHAFKRYFHKCEDIVELLAEKGDLTLSYKISQETLTSKLSIPDDELMIRLVVVMRRFLAPSDSFYYKRVWNSLYTVFSHDVPGELIDSIVAFEKLLSHGQIKLVIDSVEYTAEQIYDLISKGEYFNEEIQATEILKKLTPIPLTKLLLWNQFYVYTFDGFRLASLIFEAIKYIQDSERYQKLLDGKKLATPQCIYCLSSTNSFTSEEHIFPESLGNEEMLLPKGFVCDECNNGILSELDNYLIHFEPISLLRVYFVPYDKQGKLPKANFQNMTVEKTHPRHIRVIAKDRTGIIKNEEDLGEGWFSWKMSMRGKRPNIKKIGRALYKIALGTIALDHGPRKVLDDKYDSVRAFIQGNSDFPNNLLVLTNCQPDPNVSITYFDLPEGMPFEVSIFGIHFLMNLARTPTMQSSDMLKELGFEVFSLFG